jgi:hypothetical protein
MRIQPTSIQVRGLPDILTNCQYLLREDTVLRQYYCPVTKSVLSGGFDTQSPNCRVWQGSCLSSQTALAIHLHVRHRVTRSPAVQLPCLDSSVIRIIHCIDSSVIRIINCTYSGTSSRVIQLNCHCADSRLVLLVYRHCLVRLRPRQDLGYVSILHQVHTLLELLIHQEYIS